MEASRLHRQIGCPGAQTGEVACQTLLWMQARVWLRLRTTRIGLPLCNDCLTGVQHRANGKSTVMLGGLGAEVTQAALPYRHSRGLPGVVQGRLPTTGRGHFPASWSIPVVGLWAGGRQHSSCSLRQIALYSEMLCSASPSRRSRSSALAASASLFVGGV